MEKFKPTKTNNEKIVISIIIVIIGLIILCSEYFNSKKIAVYDYMNELYYTKENIETEIIWLENKPIGGCIACNHCLQTNNRCFMNDKVNEFLDKAENAYGFVFGSPVHFAAASGAITSFLDRAFYGRGKMFSGKTCASVVSCRRGGATAAFDQLNKYAR